MYNGMVYIYALVDSRDDRVRYIGRTVNPEKRLRKHINELEFDTHKNRWIKKLLSLNLKPYMIIIQCVEETIWREREKFWIGKCKELGFSLTNGSLGGDGFGSGKDHPHCGERSHVSKLKEYEVFQIVDLYQNKIYSMGKIGNLYNVTEPVIRGIVHRRLWKHLKIKSLKSTYINFRQKLSKWDAQCILDNKLLNRTQLSKKYNISVTNVSQIINRKRWKHLKTEVSMSNRILGNRKLSDRDVQYIIDNKLLSRKKMSVMFGVSCQTIDRIINRKTWKHLTPNIKQGI